MPGALSLAQALNASIADVTTIATALGAGAPSLDPAHRAGTLAGLMQGLRLTTALCSVFALPVLSPATAWALPQGGVVEAGTAKIITKPNKVVIIDKTPSVVIDPLAAASSAGTRYAKVSASSRGSPKQRTRTSVSVLSARTSSVTCTPAPP